MKVLTLGIALMAAAIWVVFVLRKKGEQHPALRIPGADMLLPVALLALLVFGTALIFVGAGDVW